MPANRAQRDSCRTSAQETKKLWDEEAAGNEAHMYSTYREVPLPTMQAGITL